MKYTRRALIFIALACILSPLAHASNGMVYVKGSRHWTPPDRNKTDKLGYYGGPVISNAKVYVVFWGDKINADIKKDIAAFYSSVTNSTYMDWLDEYNTFGNALDGKPGTKQHIGRGQNMGTIVIKPKNTKRSVSDEEIQAELQNQIAAGVLPKPDDNTIFMTYFPKNMSVSAFGMHSCQDFCAYHGFNGTPDRDHFYYGVMPDISGSCFNGCGYASNVFGAETAISTHELIEAVTDPFPTPGTQAAYPQAWNDRQGAEIGDICAGSNNTLKALSSKRSFIVQSEWDNNDNKCTSKTWESP